MTATDWNTPHGVGIGLPDMHDPRQIVAEFGTLAMALGMTANESMEATWKDVSYRLADYEAAQRDARN